MQIWKFIPEKFSPKECAICFLMFLLVVTVSNEKDQF